MADALRQCRTTPSEGRHAFGGAVPILAPEHLVVGQAIFNHPEDWVDLAGVRADVADVADVDVVQARHSEQEIAGDEVLPRLDEAVGSPTETA